MLWGFLGATAVTVAAATPACAAPPPVAAPDLDVVLDDELPKRLRGRAQAAKAKKLIYGSAKAYAKAKASLAQGQPKRALTDLKGRRTDLFIDRESLVRGEALSALGDHPGALKAFSLALDRAETLQVGLDSARGLRKTLHALKKPEAELKVTDALLGIRNVDNRPDLLFARAMALEALERSEEAAGQAFRLRNAFPAAAVAPKADAMLQRLQSAGAEVPSVDESTELNRIRNLIRARAYRKAETALKAYETSYPKNASAALIQRMELLRRKRARTEERALLTALNKKGLDSRIGPKVLYRLARLAMIRDDNVTAIKFFDELSRRFRRSSLAREGEFLAAWLPYNAEQYLETHQRMLAFSKHYPRASRRTEALWFSGWSAYLAKRYDLAATAWKVLLTEHEDSTLVPHARYWLGRMAHKQKKPEEARQHYRQVVAEAPLSYYGFWAQARLAELGEVIVFPAPPKPSKPPTLAELIERLGPDRPRLIDRSIALRAAGLDLEASAELRAAESTLRRVNDSDGRLLVTEALHQLGAHYLAYRLASSITETGAELMSGEPWAWRAWRQAYPDAFVDEVNAAFEAHQVDRDLIWAIMHTESRFRPWISSRVGARGLMQLMPRTAKAIGLKAKKSRVHAARFRDPASNVWLGTWYLNQLGQRYDGQIAAQVAAYNAGPGATDKWVTGFGGVALDEFIERIPYKETRRYTRRVIETYSIYRRLRGLPPPSLPQIIAKTTPSGGVGF